MQEAETLPHSDRLAPGSVQSNHGDSLTSLCGLDCLVPESQRQILTQNVSVWFIFRPSGLCFSKALRCHCPRLAVSQFSWTSRPRTSAAPLTCICKLHAYAYRQHSWGDSNPTKLRARARFSHVARAHVLVTTCTVC